MKDNILYALDVLTKLGELGKTTVQQIYVLQTLLNDEGCIDKSVVLDKLFAQSKNQDVAYRALANKIKEAIQDSISSDDVELLVVDKEVLESLKMELVKKKGDVLAHMSFSAQAKRKTQSYVKENANYKDSKFLTLKGTPANERIENRLDVEEKTKMLEAKYEELHSRKKSFETLFEYNSDGLLLIQNNKFMNDIYL